MTIPGAEDPKETADSHPKGPETRFPEFTIRNGVFQADGFAVGEYDKGTIRLNLAWMRMAGIGIEVEGDSKVDRRRFVLKREP